MLWYLLFNPNKIRKSILKIIDLHDLFTDYVRQIFLVSIDYYLTNFISFKHL